MQMYLRRFTDEPLDGDCKVVRRIQDSWLSTTSLRLCASLSLFLLAPRLFSHADVFSIVGGAREKWALEQHSHARKPVITVLHGRNLLAKGLSWHCTVQLRGRGNTIT